MAKLILTTPAGNLRTVKAAVNHGADAVYCGFGRFNLRARASSLSGEDAREVAKYIHKAGKEFYIALNTMPSDSEMREIEGVVKKIAAMRERPDALIISDPGVLKVCRSYLKDMPLHLSTQTGTFNSKSAAFWKNCGIKRVVLPREMSLDEIREINTRCSVETEVFIHGAMCVSISGRCLLGAYLAGRHPNRGDCPQPCRLRYSVSPRDLSPDLDSKEWFDAFEDEKGVYLFNSKDLNTITILDRIADTGVKALKIEGRNKSEHYISSVVKTYRAALDRYMEDPDNYRADKKWISELEMLDHRTYTTGFYKEEYKIQETGFSKTGASARVVGIVREKNDKNEPLIEVKNPFKPYETLNILPSSGKKSSYNVKTGICMDISGRKLDRAVTNRVVICPDNVELRRGDILRRIKTDNH